MPAPQPEKLEDSTDVLGKESVNLTLWVHSPEQYASQTQAREQPDGVANVAGDTLAGTTSSSSTNATTAAAGAAQKTATSSNATAGLKASTSGPPAGPPALATPLSHEIIIAVEQFRQDNPNGLHLSVGDVVEVRKAPKVPTLARKTGSDKIAQADGANPTANGDAAGLIIRLEKASMAPDSCSPLLQLSMTNTLAQAFKLENRDQIAMKKIPSPLPAEYMADHVELFFKDQYLGRTDMHRISLALADTCVYIGQKVHLAGLNTRARVGGIWVHGKQRKSALVTSETRTVFRSESAKFYIFVQLSKEMWAFDDDGSLFFEKAVDLFLPELFSRWQKRETNHVVSLVAFSRIMYEEADAEFLQIRALNSSTTSCASGGKQRYVDVYKVIIDLETNPHWPDVLRSLRGQFHNFREQVLLNIAPRMDGKMAGRISWAHEGGVLEAINMAVSALDKHYVDRDLQRTGLSIIVITAGTSRFNVDKNLLRLTTERMVDEGFGVDCVSLAKMPLHAVPLFRYTGAILNNDNTSQTVDHLYIDDAAVRSDGQTDGKRAEFYAIPHWVDSSFYAKHQDKPFRCDRFLPRCRMPQIQKTGVAEYENASIHLPLINDETQSFVKNTREWQEMSEREKRHKNWALYDQVACGAKGKYELLDLAGERTRSTSGLSVDAGRSLGSSTSLSSSSSSVSSNTSGNRTHIPEEVGPIEVTSLQAGASGNRESFTARRQRMPLSLDVNTQDPRTRKEQGTSLPSPAGLALADTPITAAQLSPLKSSRSISRPGRKRADSGASSSTISRANSGFLPRAPSLALAHLGSGPPTPIRESPSAAPTDRRVASGILSTGRQDSDGKILASKTSSSALSALRLIGTKSSTNATPTPTNASAGTGWFWQRKRNASIAPKAEAAAPDTAPKVVGGRQAGNQDTSPSRGVFGSAKPSLAPPSLSSLAPSEDSPKTSATLSVTPATPASASVSSTPHIPISTVGQHRLSALQTASAAFQVTSNDALADPRSLEEHSLHTYFLDAARQGNVSMRAVKEKLNRARLKRLSTLNPSNPAVSFTMLIDQSRRWINIFPRASKSNNQRSIKWKSLCTPACLPLYSDYIPLVHNLEKTHTRDTWALPVTAGTISFLLKPGRNVTEAAGNLLRELVYQRLAQSYQILMPTYDDIRSRRAMFKDDQQQQPDGFILPSAGQIRHILYNTTEGEGRDIYLGLSNCIQRLRFDRPSSSVVITRWRENIAWSSESVSYQYMLSSGQSSNFIGRTARFSYPQVNEYKWEALDRLIATSLEPAWDEKLRYWRTRFILVPTEVVDVPSAVLASHRVLEESATDDDVRTFGIMNLYENFSKVRWIPQGKDAAPAGLPLSYSTTILDPSLFAAAEAFRLGPLVPDWRSPSLDVPLPDAYEADLFVEDYSTDELARHLQESSRPLNLQPRRRGFRNVEHCFSGEALVSWLINEFVDVPNREVAVGIAHKLLDAGKIAALNPPNYFRDTYTFYRLPNHVVVQSEKRSIKSPTIWQQTGTAYSNRNHSQTPSSEEPPSSVPSDTSPRLDKAGHPVVTMSHKIYINVDTHKKSDRNEVALLHFDIAHNIANGFHLQLDWMCTSRLVEDLISSWQRNIEKFGYRMIEGNIRQIKDITLDNPLQAPEYIHLATSPPNIHNLAEKLGPQVVAKDYFQNQLLRMLDYLMDIEADSNFASYLHAEYSYRKSKCEHSQFVHRSGGAFVQIAPNGRGFLFLKNRLFLSHRQQGRSSTQEEAGWVDPNMLKKELQDICGDVDALSQRWDDILAAGIERAEAMAQAERFDDIDDESDEAEVEPSTIT